MSSNSSDLTGYDDVLSESGIEIEVSSAIAENNKLFAMYLAIDLAVAILISIVIFVIVNRIFVYWDKKLEAITTDLAKINSGDYSYDMNTGEEFVTAYEAESKTAGNSSAIMKALKDYQDNNGTVDDFIKEVKNNRLLDEYESFPDLRSIVNKIQNKLSEKDFHKFLDKCLTQEFRSVYAMETGMSDLD